MNRKTCIVAEGGGFRASYCVGVVKALIEEFGITSVDMAVATSGSAGILAYYATGQFDSIINIWTNLLSTWKMLSFRNLLMGNPVLNVDYLIDEVFKRQDQLDIETLKTVATEVLIPVTNYRTGEAEYFSNHDDVDFFDVLRATKAIEIFYGRPVEIAGQHYVDGALSAPIGISKALDSGATDIIVISTRPKGFKRSHSAVERLLVKAVTRNRPDRLKERLRSYPDTYNAVFDAVNEEIEKDRGKVILIQPESKPVAGRMDNSREKIVGCIEQGYADASHNEELRSFGK